MNALSTKKFLTRHSIIYDHFTCHRGALVVLQNINNNYVLSLFHFRANHVFKYPLKLMKQEQKNHNYAVTNKENSEEEKNDTFDA